MIYMILAITLMITAGILLANYELQHNREKRREALRQRARRCVRRDS